MAHEVAAQFLRKTKVFFFFPRFQLLRRYPDRASRFGFQAVPFPDLMLHGRKLFLQIHEIQNDDQKRILDDRYDVTDNVEPAGT